MNIKQKVEEIYNERFDYNFCCGGDYCEGDHDEDVKKDILEFANDLDLLYRKQLEREIKGLKVGNWKDWIKATKKYGGSKEEWNKLQTNKNWDEMLQVVLDLLKKETK
jgi:hypothetical protein